MAKVSSIQKNITRSKLVEKLRNKRQFLKTKIKDKTLSLEEEFLFKINLMNYLEIVLL